MLIFGTNGNDTVIGTPNGDEIYGFGGNDFIVGAFGDDYVDAGDGDDLIRGVVGNDTLLGGAGNDFLSPGTGADSVDGGDGIDRASFFPLGPEGALVPVTVSLLLQGQWQATGRGDVFLTGIEHLSGTQFGDALTGDGGDNWLLGGGGNDSLDGQGGDDLLTVTDGAVVAAGGSGVDTLSYFGNGATTAGVTVSLAAQGAAQSTGVGTALLTGFENLSGSAFGDVLTGDAGDNVLAGSDGSDRLSGGDGADRLLGDGEVRTDGAGPSGGAITTFDSGAAAGNDTLDGGKGNDVLVGGLGADLLTGGVGADRFVYLSAADSGPAARDRITDFRGGDVIDLSGIDANANEDGDQGFYVVRAFTGDAGQLVLAWDNKAKVTTAYLDVDGDGQADAAIEILGYHAKAQDFWL